MANLPPFRGTPCHKLAERHRAPYIHERDGYFYLFVNWDSCCQGVNCTYNIRVGRSTNITGPYVDKNGVSMASGGGTPFLSTEGNFIGPGHASIFTEDGAHLFSYHYYDGAANGTSKLNFRRLYWDESAWPMFGPPAAEVPGDYNGNGAVDAADYVLWRSTLSSQTDLRADGNGNRVVDGDDFLAWRAQFGRSADSLAASATIPEPRSWLMIFLAAMHITPRQCRGLRG